MPTTDAIDRLEAQVETLKTRLAQAEASVKTITRERDQAVAARRIDAAVRAAGVAPTAVDSVVKRALESGDWQADRAGQLTRHIDGFPDTDPLSGERVTIARFVASLREEADLLRASGSSQGSGSIGGGGNAPGVNANVPNPWMKGSWDDMEQARICRTDPARAHALAAAAGSRVGALPSV